MRNRGLRRPGVNALICAAMVVVGSASVWSGVTEMNALGHETSWTATRIAIGGLVALFGCLFFFNFIWGVRVMSAMERGEGVIARWTVPAETFDAFRELDRRLNTTGGDNDYRVPRTTPTAGVDVVFSADSVILGDTFFGLTSTGLGRFTAVRMLPGKPLCIEFGTVFTTLTHVTVTRIHHTPGVLRIPVSRLATEEAKKVLAHYQDVLARKVIVKPDFWRWRIRLGLKTALISALVAAAGFGLEAAEADLGDIPLVMAVAGAVTGAGGLVLAGLAWAFSAAQHRK